MFVLYIDPGTGSMLFSVLIGAAATLFFLSKALILKLKVFISGKKGGVTKDAAYKSYVIYNEGSLYYNTFAPVIAEFERRAIDLSYYTSDPKDPVLSASYTYIHAQYIGEGNVAYAKLNILQAGVVLMTTPGLDVYQLKRSKGVKHYAHILHMPNDATTYRLFGLDFYDSVLLTGDYQKADIRFLEADRGIAQKQLVTVGCTYLDVLASKIEVLRKNMPPKAGFTVLVSPSWGEVGVLKRYGERLLDPLAATGFNIIIRPHPQSLKVEKPMLDRLSARYKDNPKVSWDYNKDNIDSLLKADIMISDFSGIVFDYTFLCDRPVMYMNTNMDLRPYDAYDLKHELWQFATLKDIGIKLEESDFASIKDKILSVSDSPTLKAGRAKAKGIAWQHAGEAGKRVCDFMVQTLKAIEEPASKEEKTA